jgi:hypothetical protein
MIFEGFFVNLFINVASCDETKGFQINYLLKNHDCFVLNLGFQGIYFFATIKMHYKTY